ncbi:DUF2391 family protein [Rubrivirga sp.]|uniref:DUF2391 family protein n=1 Tax=Rubrivirga sp. TaxID=1885344 RepID=UPI003C76961F
MSSNSGSPARTIPETLKGYARGLVGGLIFALAPLYTTEVWLQGFIATPGIMLLATIITFCVLVAYAHYAGIHDTGGLIAEMLEALEILAIGFFVGWIILKLLGQLPSSLSFEVTVNRIVLLGLTSSVGVAVGSVQLGENPDDESDDNDQDPRGLVHEIAYSVLGAILIVSGFATTMEIVVIALEAPPWAVFGTAALSFFLALGVMSYFNFRGSGRVTDGGGIYAGGPLGDACVTYGIGLVLAAGLLWSVGRFDGTGLAPAVFMTVYLALPATLGASVGRLIL